MSAETTRQYCTFNLGPHFLGIEVGKVQEVIKYQALTRVPLSSKTVKGLINLRGKIVMAIDLRRRLGLPPLDASRTPMNVVIRTDEGAVSLLVDEIGDVVTVDADHYESPPNSLRGRARELVLGVYKLKGRLLLILDSERAMAAEEIPEPAAH